MSRAIGQGGKMKKDDISRISLTMVTRFHLFEKLGGIY